MSREYDDNQSLQQKIMSGAQKLADNVASTLGPRGRNVLLQEKGAQPFITKDGVTVAAFVAFQDPFENAAAQIIRQAAVETNNEAGDGTTTATVLAHAILSEAQKYVTAGYSPVELQRGINSAVKDILETLTESAKEVTSIEDIEHVATISANNDASIGKLISMSIDRVGQDGSITIEESRSLETSVDITEGFKFSAGYCAGAFITDPRRSMMLHDDPLFLVTDYKISSVEQILPVLEMVAREARPLIIVAEEVEGQALAAMIMNAMRGTLKIAAIKAPFYGQERRDVLEDLAVSTGATFITREGEIKLKDVKMKHFGSSKFVESTKYSTTIVGGNADYDLIEDKISQIRTDIENSNDLMACEKMQDRITRLGSGVAVIRVGGSTEVEMTERKHRIEDALEAVRSAQEEGIISGGGTALLRATENIESINNSGFGIGASIVKAACQAPIRLMAENAGESPDLIISQVLDATSTEGWDFKQGCMVDLYESGIIDPVKVTKTALQNAASCAGTLITTNFGIIQTEDK